MQSGTYNSQGDSNDVLAEYIHGNKKIIATETKLILFNGRQERSVDYSSISSVNVTTARGGFRSINILGILLLVAGLFFMEIFLTNGNPGLSIGVFFFVVVIIIFIYLLNHLFFLTSYSVSLTDGSNIMLATGAGTLVFIETIRTKGIKLKVINKL
jgi:hypothetical protein